MTNKVLVLVVLAVFTLRVLVPHVPCEGSVLVPRVSRFLHALVPHVHPTLHALMRLVPLVPRVLRGPSANLIFWPFVFPSLWSLLFYLFFTFRCFLKFTTRETNELGSLIL